MNTSALFRVLIRLALVPLFFLGLSASSSVLSSRAAGTISLGALDTAYTQNFDTLANSGTSSVVPTGWDLAESGANANTTYTAGTGSSNAGDTYSFGASGNSERALGGLLSSNLNPTFGASFTNNTGSTITSLDVSYTGEQWRLGTAGRGADRIDFQYSTNATSLTSGTWISVTALSFNSPVTAGTVGALNGNDAANRTALSASVSGLNILNSSTFWIRWIDFNVSNSDDGLGVDDFSLTPRGSSGDSAPAVVSTSPTSGATGIALGSNLTVNFSEAVDVAGSWYTISCATSGSHTASVSGGPTSFTLDPTTDFTNSETCTITILAAQVTDQDTTDPPDNMLADYGWSFTTVATSQRIRDIQGASHISPLNGQTVANVPGIVTAKRSTGFYMQDPSPDANDATSEGIFVYTASTPSVTVGDSVQVSGTVSEYRPGGSGGTENLTTTEITSPTLVVLSSGNPLPAPVVIGSGGRVPPTTVIDDDASGDVETSGVFDPANDGIDFYESLEAMRVQINRV
jgi:cation transporter-like permease